MDVLQIVYLMMAAIGGVYLLVSIFGGDIDGDVNLDIGSVDFDVSNVESPSDSITLFSLRTIATFLLGAGIAGWTSFNHGAGLGLQIISGFIAGGIITMLYYLLMKGMYALQGNSTPSVDEILGKEGIITIPTTKTGVAQVRIATKNGNVEYICKEEKGLKLLQNDTVKIISTTTGMGTLNVQKI